MSHMTSYFTKVFVVLGYNKEVECMRNNLEISLIRLNNQMEKRNALLKELDKCNEEIRILSKEVYDELTERENESLEILEKLLL